MIFIAISNNTETAEKDLTFPKRGFFLLHLSPKLPQETVATSDTPWLLQETCALATAGFLQG